MKCYDYTVRWKDSKGGYTGWIAAADEDDAFVRLYEQYGRDKLEFRVDRLVDTGQTWEQFMKHGDTYGWD